MSLLARSIRIAEAIPFPDTVTQAGIEWLVTRTERNLATASGDLDRTFARDMKDFPIALHAESANAQHYEVPAEFFQLILGPNRKYSCCLFDDGITSLESAEKRALATTALNAGLSDGQSILELGCGWGSLSLWMAKHFPNARIVAVSNSNSQREFIIRQAELLALTNLRVVTADMNSFSTEDRFDRVVSIEMFEHMANWRALLERLREWLTPEGRLFLHVFAHETSSYRFDHNDPTNWIAKYFFTGGIMPSRNLIREFGESFEVEQEWRWNGKNYQRTAEAWLANFDSQPDKIDGILRRVYGAQSSLWRRRWRLFFLATMGLFGHGGGNVWGVNHYRLIPSKSRSAG